jgi:membrane protein YfhO
VSDREPVAEPGPYEPKHPTLLAVAACALWPALLSLPMLGGLWLASQMSDQYLSGAGQAWSAEWMSRLGHLPLWNPEIFGGLPFVAAGGGDVFYPTWLLRFVIGGTAAGNLSFFLHYVLAGLFTYLFLRRLRVSWTAAVAGGLAYELSGLIASYPSPGHDGKLFASTALPLAFLALVLALRDRRWEGYPLLAVAVALALLGHFQLAYYLLIAAGLFALYLTLEEAPDRSSGARVAGLALALVAVLVGFGIAAVQILPFFEYIPFSPRAQGYYGFAGSTSYAIPWDHIPEFFFKNFVGARETYWGSNPIKLHSEYLGLPVVALAVLGARVRERRRFLLWVGGIGLLFLLISLGAGTPFYQLWWAVMPLVKKTRAPGMAFFVVAFVTAIFAALGAERALGKEGRRFTTPLLVIGGMVALLAVLGVWGQLAQSLANTIQATTGKPALAAASADQSAIRWGAFGSGVALAAAAAVFLGLARGQLTPRLAALFLVFVVGTDLLLNAWGFWSYMAPYRRDALIDRVAATPAPYRVMNLPDAYAGAELMAFDIPQVLGYHGNELRYYDELMGGKNQWRNLRYLKLWDLLAVRYAILPGAAGGADSIPGFRRILDGVRNSEGTPLRLFERTAPAPYTRVVPGAIKADSEVIITTLVDPRVGMDYSRLVLFTPDQPVSPTRIEALPAASPSTATVTAWEPGHMTISLAPAPPAPSYVLVAENWYPGWGASVDAKPVQPLRGDYSLITVPVPAGATKVELTFRSPLYETGKAISLVSLLVLVLAGAGSVAAGRKRRV